MNRSLLTALLLFAVLGTGVLLTAPAADLPKKDQAPPPPKSATLAARPRGLSRAVSAGLRSLSRQQQADGGWTPGALFGVVGFPGPVAAPGVRPGTMPVISSDVADTSMAALALLRTGYTPRRGTYARTLQRAINFVLTSVEKSDRKSIRVTDLKLTQIQVKIGSSVDTFLAALLLAEARGKMPDARGEKRVYDALQKIIDKMEANQKDDGTFGDAAWAPILGQALASRALNRARQVGMAVKSETLERAAKYASETLDRATRAGPSQLTGAAGVALYAAAAGIGGLHASLTTTTLAADNARATLQSPTASKSEKTEAREVIKGSDEAEKSFLAAVGQVTARARDPLFLRGFGTNGGEEFLSFMLISEALLARKAREWPTWDRAITERLNRTQNADGTWSGSHCITGRTFCTAAALMTLMADRASVPVAEKLK
jgi:hypothetical protein